MIESYSQQVRYKEPLLLFHNDGKKLANVTRGGRARPSRRSFPARGLAVGDYNNDGRVDVLIGNNGEAPVLLKNNAGDGNHWVGAEAAGHELQPRRRRRDHHLVVRRHGPQPLQGQRRQLPVVARHARGARPRHGREGGLGRDQVAAAERPRRTLHRRPVDRYVTIVEGKGRIDA